MMPSLDLPDPDKGRKMFEDLYGPERGPRVFRSVLRVLVPLAVVAAVLFLGAQITGSGSAILAGVRGLLSPASQSQAGSGSVPSQPGGCTITGGTNYGNIKQNCK